MSAEVPAYGLWSLVVINIAVFAIFAFSFARPRTARDRRSFPLAPAQQPADRWWVRSPGCGLAGTLRGPAGPWARHHRPVRLYPPPSVRTKNVRCGRSSARRMLVTRRGRRRSFRASAGSCSVVSEIAGWPAKWCGAAASIAPPASLSWVDARADRSGDAGHARRAPPSLPRLSGATGG